MAIFHCQVKIISRGKGQSAIASAAYRSGTRLKDERTKEVQDYTKKHFIEYSEIQLPENAPKEYQDRATLWNAVEKVEKPKNSRLAREIEVALPRELNLEQQKRLVHDYVESQFVSEGMCADWSIHNPKPDDKHPERPANPHAHIMLTVRSIKKNGKWAPKRRSQYKLDEDGNRIPKIDPNTGKQKLGARNAKQWERESVSYNNWNDRSNVEKWRKAWANECNKYLEPDHQIDHRSNLERGINKIPTKHEGYYAHQNPERTDLGRYTLLVKQINQFMSKVVQMEHKLIARMKELKIHGQSEPFKGISEETPIQYRTTGAGKLRGARKEVSSQEKDNRTDTASSDQLTQTAQRGQASGIHEQSLPEAIRGILRDFRLSAKVDRQNRLYEREIDQREQETNRIIEAYAQRESQIEADKQSIAGRSQQVEASQRSIRRQYHQFTKVKGFARALEELTRASRNHRSNANVRAFYEDDLDQSLGKHARER